MKKIVLTALAVPALALGTVSGTFTAQAAEVERYEVYLGETVSQSVQADGAWQSNAILAAGCSSVRFGMEVSGADSNKFLRLANFDGYTDSSYTSVNVALDSSRTWESALSVQFSYRLCEGQNSYRETEEVLSVEVGGKKQILTFSDLTYNAQGDYNWKEGTVSLSVAGAAKADKMTVSFFFEKGTTYSGSGCYFDLDDLSVSSGANVLNSNGDFESADVSTSSEKILEIDYATNSLAAKEQYLLGEDEIFDYSANTIYTDTQETGFDGGKTAVMLARSGSSGTYRGATSVNAGEGDSYAVYDSLEENTYLRLANFNGNEGVKSSRFVMYFYDNSTGELGNMPQINYIYYTFSYRLYIDDITRLGMTEDDTVLELSTRSSSQNNSGKIKLRELTVNEQGDDTWHTYSGILETQLSTTKSIVFIYYGSPVASFNTETYIDMDNLTLATYWGETNYAHLNGTFEGLVPTDSTADPMNEQVYSNGVLGGQAEKYAVSSSDYCMKLKPSQTVSLRLGWTPVSNVYHASFSVLGDSGNIKVYFSGRNGTGVTLTCGKNETLQGGALRVAWLQENGTWKCNLYYARLVPDTMLSLDFVNVGTEDVLLDDVFIGQVASVCNTAGDYQAYISALSARKTQLSEQRASYTAVTVGQLDVAVYKAEKLDENASQARMTAALTEIDTLLNSGTLKADLTELEKTIVQAETIISEYGKSAYTKASWLVFENALTAARGGNAENTQDEINALTSNLTNAINALTEVTAEPSASGLGIALGVSGGVLATGGIALGAFLIKRRGSR